MTGKTADLARFSPEILDTEVPDVFCMDGSKWMG